MGKKNIPPLSTRIDERYSQTIPQIMPLAPLQSINVSYGTSMITRFLSGNSAFNISLFAKAGMMLPATGILKIKRGGRQVASCLC